MSIGSKDLKIVVIGDTNVGKTCLLQTYSTNNFPLDYVPTVFDNYSIPISVDHVVYQLNVWDTSGSETYEEMRPLSYTSTDCFMITFSVTDEESFHKIKTYWINEIKENCGDPNPRILLIGTKSDSRKNEKVKELMKKQNMEFVSESAMKQMAKEIGARGYIECSALTQNNLSEVFEMAAMIALDMLPVIGEENVETKNKPKKISFLKKIFKKMKK